MIFSVWYGIGLFILSIILACLEIQIEGKDGWAQNLPCWRPKDDSFVDQAYKKIMGKQLTGYHLGILALVLFVLHFPFFIGIKWTLVDGLKTISAFFLVGVAWGFLWFVLNPHYGLRKFKPQYIWWHKKWIGEFIPIDYLNRIVASVIFATIASLLAGVTVLHQWFCNVFLVLLIGTGSLGLIRQIIEGNGRMRGED
jgi:hypothetical protein